MFDDLVLRRAWRFGDDVCEDGDFVATENSDGTILTNLAGYTVYYGTDRNNLSKSVKVSNPGLASYTVTGLTSGTWYLARLKASTFFE